MKIRAVIFRPAHTNDIFTVTKKVMVNDTLFKRGDCIYEINNDHFQVTTDAPWWRLWTFKRYFTTYYYSLGNPKPLPVPNFGIEISAGMLDGEELAAMWEPWLWRTIAGPVRGAFEKLQFYLTVGTLIGVVYLIWKQASGHPADPTDLPAGGMGP